MTAKTLIFAVLLVGALLLLPGVATAMGHGKPGPTCQVPVDVPTVLAEQCPCAGPGVHNAS